MWGQKIIVIKSRSEIRYKGRLSFEINQMRGRRPERVEKNSGIRSAVEELAAAVSAAYLPCAIV